jgi:parallel beta-helix repeat protein
MLLMITLCFPRASLSPPKLEASVGKRVHNLETGLGYATIQEAIDAPETLNTNRIVVDNGTYYENLKVTKAVTLIGQSEQTTIVDGMGLASVVELDSNNITLTGFTLRNCGFGWAQGGVALSTVGYCNVSGNNITSNYYGIWLNSSADNVISGNNIANNGYAIGLYGPSNRNSILENNVTASAHAGILLVSPVENNVSNNNITDDEYGVELVSSSNNTIMENNIASNSHGLALYESSNGNEIARNYVLQNGWGFETDTSVGNRIYNNDFINNTSQVFFYDSGFANAWDSDYPVGGNYWSDYNGTDAHSGPNQNETGSDGIGDSPRRLNANNEDRYPLMGIFQDIIVSLPPYPTGGTAHIGVISNSTVSNLQYVAWLNSPNQYLQTGQMLVQFSTSEQNGTGFCRLLIPTTCLNVSSYTVLVDGEPVNATQFSSPNSTKIYLYITYSHSSHDIIVTIPELQTVVAFLMSITPTPLLIIYLRRKHGKAHAPTMRTSMSFR